MYVYGAPMMDDLSQQQKDMLSEMAHCIAGESAKLPQQTASVDDVRELVNMLKYFSYTHDAVKAVFRSKEDRDWAWDKINQLITKHKSKIKQ